MIYTSLLDTLLYFSLFIHGSALPIFLWSGTSGFHLLFLSHYP